MRHEKEFDKSGPISFISLRESEGSNDAAMK